MAEVVAWRSAPVVVHRLRALVGPGGRTPLGDREAAPVEEDRPAGLAVLEGEDAPDDDVVVTGDVDLLDRAVHAHEHTGQARPALLRRDPVQRVEARAVCGAEPRDEVTLVVPEHVDGEAALVTHPRPRPSPVVGAEEHERRMQGHRREGLAGGNRRAPPPWRTPPEPGGPWRG